MSNKYGGVIQDYLEESASSFEPLQLQELPISDRSDVTIFVNVHSLFLMERLYNDVSSLTVSDLYVTAAHNNSMHRTEPGRVSSHIKFKRTMEIGDIDEVSKRINVTLSAKTALGISLVYGEVAVPLPKFIDVPGQRFRMKIPLSDEFQSKLLKSQKKKPVLGDESQEESYKKSKVTGKKGEDKEAAPVPTIAVIELTVELASPVSKTVHVSVCVTPNLTVFADFDSTQKSYSESKSISHDAGCPFPLGCNCKSQNCVSVVKTRA